MKSGNNPQEKTITRSLLLSFISKALKHRPVFSVLFCLTISLKRNKMLNIVQYCNEYSYSKATSVFSASISASLICSLRHLVREIQLRKYNNYL